MTGGLRPLRLRGLILVGIACLPWSVALAFDIPTPQNQPKPVNPLTLFSAQPTTGPITPLPPTADLVSGKGAGELPDGVSIETSVRVPPAGLLQRAEFLVTLRVIDRQKSIAQLTLHRPEGEHFLARRVTLTQHIETLPEGGTANVREYQWAVTPLAAGTQVLHFVTMHFQVAGAPGVVYGYQPVARKLTARALPAFWPESLPVSPTLTLQREPLPALQAGQPQIWRLRITGRGLTEYALKHMLAEQLIDQPGLHFDSLDLRRSPIQPIPRDDVLAQTFDADITITPDPNGQGITHAELPALKIPYLDSHAAEPGTQLSEVVLPAQLIGWTPLPSVRFWQALRFWSWRVGLATLVLWGLGVWLRDRWRSQQARRRHQAARRLLAAQPTADALWHQLQQLTGGHSSGALITRAPNPRFIEALQALDSLRFANQDPSNAPSFETVRDELSRWLPARFFHSS